MLQLNKSFPRNYKCELLSEMPVGERFYYPGASTQSGSDGPIVRITPYSGAPWVGVFAFGMNSPKDGVTGLYTFPDPNLVCVVALGDGYLVNASNPREWNEIEVYPICAVIPNSSRNLFIFASHTDMTAFGASGVIWRTKRLAWSEMKITTVATNFIKGETWDIRSDSKISFCVDISNGDHTGGIVEV